MVIGHVVISLPYTILVLMPRLQQIDVSLEEAAYDLGASRLRTFRSITLPLILPAVVSAFLIAFTTSFDEYAVASFVVGTRATFPIYLYSALRFPNQLPQVIAVAVVVITISLVVVVAAEGGRRDRRTAARRGRRAALDRAGGAEQGRVLRGPVERDQRADLHRAQRFVGKAVAEHAARAGLEVELCVHPEEDDLGDPPLQPRLSGWRSAAAGRSARARGELRPGRRRLPRARAGRRDHPFALAEPHHRVVADELVDRELERVQRADEVGDERRRRVLVDLARAADLLDRPPFMTAIRSDIASASSWSCVT